MHITPLCTGELRYKVENEVAHISPVRCKRWSCEICAPFNRKQVIEHAVAGNPRAMLTLTLKPAKGETPPEVARRLKKGLVALRLRLKRHPQLQNFEFCAVFEKHKSGFPHLHLLITGQFIPWKKLRGWWAAITGSYMIDIRAVRGKKSAAYYVAKYLGKDLSGIEGCKRWWRSKGYPRPEPRKTETEEGLGRWSRLQADIFQATETLAANGWEITQHRNLKFEARQVEEGAISLLTGLQWSTLGVDYWAAVDTDRWAYPESRFAAETDWKAQTACTSLRGPPPLQSATVRLGGPT